MVEAKGITRRQVIKRGLVIGAGVVWATPAIQVIQVNKAYAQVTSPGGGNVENPGDNGNGGGNGGTPPSGNVPDDVLDDVITPEQPSAGTPTQVGAGTTGQQRAPATGTTAETLPFTGIEVFPMAALGAGLMAAGTAALKIAKHAEGSDQPSPEGD